MHFLIIGLLILAAGYFLLNSFAYADAAKILSYSKKLLVILVLGLVVFLIARGGVQFLWLGILALLPWINRLRVLSGLYQTFKQFRGQKPNSAEGAESNSKQKSSSYTSSNMNYKQALEILELKEGASTQDIKSAHHRLMLKHHPDHGGNVEMASLINRAKDILLETK